MNTNTIRILKKITVFSLLLLASFANAKTPGIAMSLDISTIEQAKDVYFSYVI